MKRSSLLLVALVTAGLAACGKEAPKPAPKAPEAVKPEAAAPTPPPPAAPAAAPAADAAKPADAAAPAAAPAADAMKDKAGEMAKDAAKDAMKK